MFKYCFYILLLTLLMDCGNGRSTHRPTGIPGGNLNIKTQTGQCFYVLMDIANVKLYEIFLAEAPQSVCGKTGGRWLVNKQIYFGASACTNWTAAPTVAITFNMDFTQIQNVQITPRGSGGSFVGNRGVSTVPILLQANAPVQPQNEDDGWGARIPARSLYSGYIDFYCGHCDFNKNKDMDIEIKYRGQELGTVSLNPKSTIARCPSTTTPSHVYPR